MGFEIHGREKRIMGWDLEEFGRTRKLKLLKNSRGRRADKQKKDKGRKKGNYIKALRLRNIFLHIPSYFLHISSYFPHNISIYWPSQKMKDRVSCLHLALRLRLVSKEQESPEFSQFQSLYRGGEIGIFLGAEAWVKARLSTHEVLRPDDAGLDLAIPVVSYAFCILRVCK